MECAALRTIVRSSDESRRLGYANGETRYEVLLAAEIDGEDWAVPVSALIKNISTGGVKVRTPRASSLSGDVVISIRDVGQFAARVAWSSDLEAGIKFRVPINVVSVLEQRQSALAARGANVIAFVARSRQRLGLMCSLET
jgi:PilZ domain